MAQPFYWLDGLHITQSKISKHWKKTKALTLTNVEPKHKNCNNIKIRSTRNGLELKQWCYVTVVCLVHAKLKLFPPGSCIADRKNCTVNTDLSSSSSTTEILHRLAMHCSLQSTTWWHGGSNAVQRYNLKMKSSRLRQRGWQALTDQDSSPIT